MKNLLFINFFFYFLCNVVAQNKANTAVNQGGYVNKLSDYPTVYYSYYGFMTTKEFGAYKGVVTTSNSEFVVTITDTVTNIKRGIERFSDNTLTIRTGEWEEYDTKGRVFKTAKYANDKEQDLIEYDSLGKIHKKNFYAKNTLTKSETYYADGKVNYTTDYENIYLSRTKKLRPNGSVIYNITNNRGVFRAKFLDENGKEAPYDSTELAKDFYCDKNGIIFALHNNPEFQGGGQAMFKFIETNTEYPKAALDNHISGIVLVYFIVNTDGELTKLVPAGYPHQDLMREALRMVKSMPKWKSAKLNGKPVAARFILPVKYSWNNE